VSPAECCAPVADGGLARDGTDRHRTGIGHSIRCVTILALTAALACGGPAPETGTATANGLPEGLGSSAGSSLLPDVGGRPQVVAVAAASARRAALRNAELVTNVVNGLAASTRFWVLTNDRAAFTVARAPAPERVRFLDLPFASPITIWTQDPFLVLAGDGGRTTLLASRGFERADDRLMAERIAAAAGYALESSRLFFEGGNVVSDREHVLIGANTVRYNAAELDVAETEVVLRFEAELGRRVLVVGPFPQPVAHIDMAITPLGERRVAVADAAAGARIAERALETDPASVAAFETFCEEHFFGHPSIREIQRKGGATSAAPTVRGKTGEMIAKSREVAPLLDGVAHGLERLGYRVERVPFLFGGPESRDPPEDGDEPVTQATYPMLSYNNVLLEDGAGGRLVYLPRYGWPAFDDAAAAAWRELGFTPRPIDGLVTSAMYGGALRCSVKVLER
jgi:hypothetical protein